MSTPRVAIVGGGMTGSVCAWALKKAGLQVTIFEMGRGAGGRMATRRSRDVPGLAINHGAPLFTASTEKFQPIVEWLLNEAKVLRPWQGKYGTLDAQSMEFSAECDSPPRYTGVPSMSAICESLSADVDRKFSTMVSSMEFQDSMWVLTDKESKNLGTFDWLVVSSHTLAHDRWTEIFGSPPPLKAAAQKHDSSNLPSMASRISHVTTNPIVVVMVAFPGGPAASEFWSRLPFDMAEIKGSEKVGKIVKQVGADPKDEDSLISIVIHSTPEFGFKYRNVHSASGTAARMGAITSSTKETDVAKELYDEFVALIQKYTVDEPTPTWGPTFHRWGGAFPNASEEGGQLFSDTAMKVVLAGDHVQNLGALPGTVEAAALSGLASAELILSSSKMGKL